MTLGCLAPYRRLGIGRLIERLLYLLFMNILREACCCTPGVYSRCSIQRLDFRKQQMVIKYNK